jgi:uncharacterized protein (TIRG00374 family)
VRRKNTFHALNAKTALRRSSGLIAIAGLLYFALRKAPLREIWHALAQLHGWQFLTLLLVNAGIYALLTLRWWLIVRVHSPGVPFAGLIAVRVAAFGVSYFTLGPQVGGEPLQVLYLRRRYGLAYARATACVLMDKLLELLANCVLLAAGVAAVVRAGIVPAAGHSVAALIGLALLLFWPPAHLILLMRGIHPLSAAIRRISRGKMARFMLAAERRAGVFCRRHPLALLAAAAVSLVAVAGMLGEYCLILMFLRLHLPFVQALGAWTAAWLSFLLPLPGGLGALEASQVFTLGAFGVTAAASLGVACVIRGRDLLIGGVGLALAVRDIRGYANRDVG